MSVPAYYEGQRTAGIPNHYVDVSEATRLKRTGKASAINRGKAILIRGPRRPTTSLRESVKRAWKVVGQTPKHATEPGFPRWNCV